VPFRRNPVPLNQMAAIALAGAGHSSGSRPLICFSWHLFNGRVRALVPSGSDAAPERRILPGIADLFALPSMGSMHTRELIELAGMIATRGDLLIAGEEHLQPDGAAAYWSAAQCRSARWSRAMKQHSLRVCASASEQAGGLWTSIRPTLEEILASEVLCRVFAAVCCVHEKRHGSDELTPIVRVVMSRQMETRLRALNLLVYGHGLRIEDSVNLNRLRKLTERWVDLLLSLVGAPADVAEFAFRQERLREFSAQWRMGPTGQAQRTLTLASLRIAYQYSLSNAVPNADLNQKIASGVMGCLDSTAFDSTGLMKSTWLESMSCPADDVQGLLDDLFSDASSPPPAFNRNDFRSRTNRLDLP
jgi:hypothetical protein